MTTFKIGVYIKSCQANLILLYWSSIITTWSSYWSSSIFSKTAHFTNIYIYMCVCVCVYGLY